MHFHFNSWGGITKAEGFPCGSAVKNPPAMQETWVRSPRFGEILWRRTWQPTPVFLPGESPRTEEPGGIQFMDSRRVGHG